MKSTWTVCDVEQNFVIRVGALENRFEFQIWRLRVIGSCI